MLKAFQRVSFIFLTSLLFLLSAGLVPAHGGAVTAHEFGGHLYLIVDEPLTWVQADAEARAAAGHLAMIDTELENQFIYTHLLARGITTTASDGGGAKYAWLGGSDSVVEGVWRWVDGSLFSSGYTKWGQGPGGNEPDNFQGQQHYLAMGLQGWPVSNPGGLGNASEWNDVQGGNTLAYIIEFDAPNLDSDGDGMLDWEEFISDTNPTNAASLLQTGIEPSSSSEVEISWQGSEKCSYHVMVSTNLLESDSISLTNMPGINTQMGYTHETSASHRFYTIRAER